MNKQTENAGARRFYMSLLPSLGMIQITENVRSLTRSVDWLVCGRSLVHSLRLLRHKTCRREYLCKL